VKWTEYKTNLENRNWKHVISTNSHEKLRSLPTELVCNTAVKKDIKMALSDQDVQKQVCIENKFVIRSM